MKCFKLLQYVLLLCITSVFAQVNIKGKIIDAETGEILSGANIYIESVSKGVSSDEKGVFELTNLGKDELKIKFSFLGYESVVKDFTGSSENEINVNIRLYKKEIPFDQIIVTASRNEQTIGDVAGKIALINNRTIASTPNRSVDDLFKGVSGVYIDRSSGMFGSSTVNVRGVTSSEQGRILAMVDGLPINKTDGGTVNWNRLNSDNIERIEIFKGPGSSVYGNNAMGGVINMITKKNTKKGFKASAGADYGTYETFQQKASVNYKMEDNGGLNLRLSGFHRKGDGYNTVREQYRDIYSINSGLKETGIDGQLGYEFSPSTNISATFSYFDDERGSGTKVKEENYQSHQNNWGSVSLNTMFSDIKLNFSAFYQLENYLKTMEKYKISSGKLSSYDLIYVDADRIDYGSNVNLTIPVADHQITTGVEVKMGKIDGADVYKTSTDVIANKGDMLFLSGFVQDEFHLLSDLKVFVGLRVDNVSFSNGSFMLINPTKATDFMKTVTGNLKDYDWTSVTPKLSLQYKLNKDFSVYSAYSQGFRAGTLDDLTRSGLIKLGFKLANPELKPEKIDNFELGFNYNLDNSLYIMPSIYLMKGHDFMAYINTGQTINMSGKNRPIIKKDNITKVDFFGFDLDVKYFISANLNTFVNYTYTKTEIKSFIGSNQLEGKQLTYTPDHLANFGISYLNEYANATLNFHYQSKQFLNDDNSEKDSNGNSMIVPATTTIDMRIWKKLFNMINVSLDVQNLLDKKEVTSYDRISLGRVITAGVSVDI